MSCRVRILVVNRVRPTLRGPVVANLIVRPARLGRHGTPSLEQSSNLLPFAGFALHRRTGHRVPSTSERIRLGPVRRGPISPVNQARTAQCNAYRVAVAGVLRFLDHVGRRDLDSQVRRLLVGPSFGPGMWEVIQRHILGVQMVLAIVRANMAKVVPLAGICIAKDWA